tara:strand:+ start:6606 stop:6947 length:342 start_codon:yes stop_codon:yes gene_type:complete
MDRLTQEQQFLLKRVEMEAAHLSKEELIDALVDCWEARFRLKQAFTEYSRDAGMAFRLEEARSPYAPETIEDLTQLFGYEPTDEEALDYYQSVFESNMEVDMDEIVLGHDNEP